MTRKNISEKASTLTAKAVEGKSGDMVIQLITPGWGSSGYYSADVLEAAGKNGVFPAGTQMFVNHQTADERNNRPEGDVMGLAAVLQEDATWDGSALVARAKPFQHWAPVLADMAESIGVSIRASAEISEGEAEGRRGLIVDELVEAQSVDFVTRAGRGGRIREVLESAHAQQIEEHTPNVPVSSAGQTTESHQKGKTVQIEDAQYAQLTEAAGKVTPLIAERDTLTAKVAEAEARAAAAETALAEANARTEADKRVRETVAKTDLVAAAGERVVREAMRSVPVKDGALDVATLDATVAEAITAESNYLAALAPQGVTGFGSSNVGESGKHERPNPWARNSGKVA